MTTSLRELVAHIESGMSVAVPTDYSGVAMSAIREIIRQDIKKLHLIGVPTCGLQAELLIGAGAVEVFESSALTLGEYNPAPCFSRAVKNSTIKLIDATCPAIHAALQASQKGIPFMPLRGIIGSDLLNHHPNWKTIQNPLAEQEDPIVIIPAIKPDFALFHAPLVDEHGNVWVGRRKELVTMSQASRGALVTAEKLYEGNLLEDEKLAAGTLPSLYVTASAVTPNGSWPLSFWHGRDEDSEHLKLYCKMAKTEEGFREYLDQFVFQEVSQ
ncbi:CoA transferase subunit A [Sneathiella glossodoripedis]|uniref:CoA transferase subunit A n=1 Tax=Sneathiella glossodoripedis TaxID=418853 RepID=UPI00046FA2EC|nr:CoA-transferase [Sneathiella glossodoripedis]